MLKPTPRTFNHQEILRPFVTFQKTPVPIWPTHTSKGPALSETNERNLPSREMVASNSAPSNSVSLNRICLVLALKSRIQKG